MQRSTAAAGVPGTTPSAPHHTKTPRPCRRLVRSSSSPTSRSGFEFGIWGLGKALPTRDLELCAFQPQVIFSSIEQPGKIFAVRLHRYPILELCIVLLIRLWHRNRMVRRLARF